MSATDLAAVIVMRARQKRPCLEAVQEADIVAAESELARNGLPKLVEPPAIAQLRIPLV